jgi:predicted ABC-type transport system involved in lysophospholipase L1 biosynthesis ATPase subunit
LLTAPARFRTGSRAASSSGWRSRARSGNLDDATGTSVLELLDSVTRRAGKTLMLVTHSREVAALADRELKVEGGRFV